jgi:hypothetical protein
MRLWIVAMVTLLALAGAVPARAAQTPPAAPPELSISWVGDMAFSRSAGLPPNGGKGIFADVTKLLGASDVSTGNLEGTLGRGGPSKCKGNCFAFQAPPSYARVFARAGFDLLNMANNHSRDFGTTGMAQTIAALRGAGIAHTGLKGEITVLEVKGRKVAFVGFAPYPWTSPLTDIPAARRVVVSAGRRADVVVVLMHAGAEGAGALHTPHGTEHAFGENRGSPRRFAHTMVDAGAAAVLGSGPHVLRGLECYRNALIAYSLGNFAAWRTLSTGGVLGLSGVLQLRLDAKGRFAGGRLWPVRLTPPGLPRRDPTRAAIGLVRRLSKDDFGRRACPMSATGVIQPRR